MFIITICFLSLSQSKSYGSDDHISYSLDEILEKVETANSNLKTKNADIKYSKVFTIHSSKEINHGLLQ